MTSVVLQRGGERIARLDRRRVPHGLILRAIPAAIGRRFDPASATGLDATLELRVRSPGGGQPTPFTLRIENCRCEVSPGSAGAAGAVATVGAEELIRLVTGSVGWPQLLSSGSLELTGDPFLALRFPSLFRLPARRPREH